MTKHELEEYQRLKRKIETKQRLLQALKASGTQVLQDSVKGSTKAYPYTEVTFHLEGVSEESGTEAEQEKVRAEIEDLKPKLSEAKRKVQNYIDCIQDDSEALVLECVYIRGYTQRKTADIVNYDAAWVNRVIKKYS